MSAIPQTNTLEQTSPTGTKFYNEPSPEDVLTSVRSLSAWAAALMTALQSGSVTSIATLQSALSELNQTAG
jgi:hypothetical protein